MLRTACDSVCYGRHQLVFGGDGSAGPADQLVFVPLVFAGMLPRKRGTEGAHGDGNEEGASSTHRGHAGRRSKRLDMETEGQREARLRRMRQNRARKLASETEEQRKARLEGLRQYQTRRLASETEEQRKARLEGLRQYQTRCLATETAEQREARLAQLAQHRAKRLATEAESLRQAKRLSSETAEQRMARLEHLRSNQALRLEPETEEQRQVRLARLRINQALRLESETEEQRQARLDRLRSNQAVRLATETDEQRHTRLEALREHRECNSRIDCQPMMTCRDQYLHHDGWAYNAAPLHMQPWVVKEMEDFHKMQSKLENRSCIVCHERWPTRQKLAAKEYVCIRCSRDKRTPKLYSAENDMLPGPRPLCLEGLTQVEEMLIARACPIMCVYRKHGGQRGYRGHVLNLPQDVQGFVDKLPRPIADMPVLLVRRRGTDNSHADFRVRRACVLTALQWLKINNRFYHDIQIDLGVIHELPTDDIASCLLHIEEADDVPQPDCSAEETDCLHSCFSTISKPDSEVIVYCILFPHILVQCRYICLHTCTIIIIIYAFTIDSLVYSGCRFLCVTIR